MALNDGGAPLCDIMRKLDRFESLFHELVAAYREEIGAATDSDAEESEEDEELDADGDGEELDADSDGEEPARQISMDCWKEKKKKMVVVEEEGVACAICLEDMAAGREGEMLECPHMLQEMCLLPRLSKKLSCPVCRFNIFS